MRKRFTAMLLALALCLGLCAVPALAMEPFETKVDLSEVVINDSCNTTAFGRSYTLGSVGSDLTILVIGRITCGRTQRALKTAVSEFSALGVKNGDVYLLDVDQEKRDVQKYAAEHPSFVHVSYYTNDKKTPYNRLFWDITYACDGRGNQSSASLPAVCVLDKSLTPIYYASYNTFDEDALKEAIAPYAGDSFADVPDGQYYTKAVNWAVSGKVTTGRSATSFDPGASCTHAEIITFLWRAVGRPVDVTVNSLTPEVPAGKEWAATALGWGDMKGMYNWKFLDGGMDAPCSRADAVYYIWRAFGAPEAGSSGFTDVPDGMPYSAAVSWAVKNGITNGYGDTFRPDKTCSRGEIVTFLHRAFDTDARLK